MKKLLTTAFILSALVANSQDIPSAFSKGSKYLVGKLGYTYNTSINGSESIKTHDFKIAPGMGYFIADHLALGGSLSYSGTSAKSNNSKSQTNAVFAIEPFARKYFSMGSESFFPFAQLDSSFGLQVAGTKTDEKGQKTNKKKFAWGLNLRPGFSYLLSSRIALDASIGSLGYNDNTNQLYADQPSKTYTIGFNLSDVKFGVQIFL